MDAIGLKKYFLRIKNFLLSSRFKEFLIFLIFFLISSVFWISQSLSETFDVELQIPLRLSDIPSDVVITSELPPYVTLSVRDKGTSLVRYIYDSEPVKLDFSYVDYDIGEKSGKVVLPMNDVVKKFQSQLLSSTVIVSLRPDTLEYYFNTGMRKRVPVRISGKIETSKEYYLKEITLSPDSVEVLAPNAILDTLTEVFTYPTYLTNLCEDAASELILRRIRGAKLIPEHVKMYVDIDMYTDKTITVPIKGIDFPQGKSLRTFPSNADVTFRVGMSSFKEITEKDFSVTASFNDALEREGGKLPLHLVACPDGVSNVRINPDEVDYLIELTYGEAENNSEQND